MDFYDVLICLFLNPIYFILHSLWKPLSISVFFDIWLFNSHARMYSKLFYKLYSKLVPNVQLMPQFHHPHPHLHANYWNQIAAAASYCTIVDPGQVIINNQPDPINGPWNPSHSMTFVLNINRGNTVLHFVITYAPSYFVLLPQ